MEFVGGQFECVSLSFIVHLYFSMLDQWDLVGFKLF